jgi:kynureninase
LSDRTRSSSKVAGPASMAKSVLTPAPGNDHNHGARRSLTSARLGSFRFFAKAVAGMAVGSAETSATERDCDDPLARFRAEFYLPPGQIYLDGNSLGPLSRRSEASTLRALGDWKTRAIGGWLDGDPPWFTLAETLGGQMARLVGAEPDEVIVANSTTVNLHQMLATLYHPEGRRIKILADALSFPTDIYAIESHLRLRGLDPATHLELVESGDGRTLAERAILEKLTDEVALAILPSVVYRSGQLLDLATIAAEGRSRGVLIGFDGSHSVGAVPHAFDA